MCRLVHVGAALFYEMGAILYRLSSVLGLPTLVQTPTLGGEKRKHGCRWKAMGNATAFRIRPLTGGRDSA